MSTSSQLKEKYRKSSRLSLHDCDEGTAARTRPFSYEEIVLRRKYKHLSEDVEDAVIEAELTSTEGIVKNASHGIESERSKQYYKDCSPIGENLPSDKPAKTSSRKRKRHISASAACEDVIKGNDSQVIELEPKLQYRQDKYMNKEVKVGKTNTESHGERKYGNYGTNDNRSEVERKLSDYSKGKKSHAYQSGGKYEKEIKRKYLNGDAEKCEDRSAAKKSDAGRHGLDISHRNERVTSLKSRIEVSRKYQNRGYEASEDKSAAKKRDPDGCHDLDNLRRKDRKELSKSHTEILSKYQSRDDKKREDRNAANKRDPGRHYDLDNSGRKDRKEISKSNVEESIKCRNGDDGKLDRGSAAKKYELERHFNLDISGRKERKESSKSRVDESKLGRRRSRSRGHVEGNEKSSSLSPRSHKRTSHEKGEHTEFSSHISKDRSKRQHSDVDRSRVLNNGSSSHHWRHGESSNRLGGYSPRKRISEAAAKTPSPPYRSPEKKSAKWDLPPAENLSVSVSSTFQSSKSTVSSKVYDSISSVHVASITMEPLPRFSGSASITKKFASIDSIQLTQSTRHMRRLYLEEIPSSTSEKVLLECLNNLFLSSGVNHVEGAQPCISCIVSVQFLGYACFILIIHVYMIS